MALAKRLLPALSIAALAWLAFTCSNPVDKQPRTPVLSIVSDTTVSVKDSLVLVAHTGTGGGKATVYLWFLDGRILAAPVAADSICRLFFGIADTGGHVVVVKALGEGKSVSGPDTAQVTVLLNPPVVHFVTRDTTVFAGDTVKFGAQGKDSNGTVIAYRWSIGDTAVAATAGTLAYCFPPVAGTYRIRVTAMDDDSILSAPDSIHVSVVVDNPRIAAQHDTVVAVNDTVILRATRLDTFSSPVLWLWARNGVLFSDTTQGPLFAVRFGRAEAGTRTVLVKAVSSHRLKSNIDSVHVAVHLYAPTVSMVHDTAVFANDPVTLRAYGADTNGRVAQYVWALDGSHFSDTTLGDSIVHTWSRADTGSRIVVRVKAIDDDTIASNADSVHVTVHLKPLPTVTVTPDTAVFINDSFSLAAKAVPGGASPVTAFVWAVDNRPFGDTSAAGRKAFRFSRADTGRHVVRVEAIDRDTMVSLAESTVVHVRLGMPVVKAMNDTAVFVNDTAVVHAAGSDTNGVVVRYLWSIDKGGYTDTTVPGVFAIVWTKQDTGRHTVRVKAVDDDTVLSKTRLVCRAGEARHAGGPGAARHGRFVGRHGDVRDKGDRHKRIDCTVPCQHLGGGRVDRQLIERHVQTDKQYSCRQEGCCRSPRRRRARGRRHVYRSFPFEAVHAWVCSAWKPQDTVLVHSTDPQAICGPALVLRRTQRRRCRHVHLLGLVGRLAFLALGKSPRPRHDGHAFSCRHRNVVLEGYGGRWACRHGNDPCFAIVNKARAEDLFCRSFHYHRVRRHLRAGRVPQDGGGHPARRGRPGPTDSSARGR